MATSAPFHQSGMDSHTLSGPASRFPVGRGEALLLSVILAGAIALRVWGIGFGLPYLYHPDEPGKIQIAQDIVKTGDLNPHYFRKPTLLIYANALLYVPYYFVGKANGRFTTVQDIPPPVRLEMGVGYIAAPDAVLMGRLLTAAMGVLGVGLTWLVGRRIVGPGPALIGALLVALSPANVEQSHYIETNAFLVVAILGVLWFSLNIYQRGLGWDYLLAGFLTGVAVSCKYPGAVAIVCPLAAHWLRSGRRLPRDRYFQAAMLAVPVGFLLFTPFALLDPLQFVIGAGSEAVHYASGHEGAEGWAPLWYLRYALLKEGPMALLGGVAIVVAWRRRLDRVILLAAFPLAYFIFISCFQVRNNRTYLPLAPFLALLGGWLLLEWLRQLRAWPEPGRRLAAAAALLLVAGAGVVVPLREALAQDRRLAMVNSRETARVWIEQNVLPGSRIAFESYSPFVAPDKYAIEPIRRIIDHPPDWYREHGVQYLVFSRVMYGRFFRDSTRYAEDVAQYRDFWQRFPLVRQFNDGGVEVRIHAIQP